MASRFWVGGTGTWDGSDTTHWASSSGGAGGQSVPGSSDTVTLDGSSGGGTVTVNTNADITSLTMGAFTGTLTYATNNNNLTTQTLSITGTGTRTLTLGSGTITITGTTGTVVDCTTATNLTFNAGSGKLLFAATPTGQRTATGNAAITFNNVEIDDAGNVGACALIFNGMKTATFTPTDVRTLQIGSGSSFTVTNGFTWTGSLTRPPLLSCASSTTGTGTLSVAGTCTGTLIAVNSIVKAGAGSITLSNSFDLGSNTGITITAPAGTSASGGSSGVIGG